MLVYKIEIQGDIDTGEVWYNVDFRSGAMPSDLKKINSADVEKIYSTVEKLTDALRDLSNLQKQ